MKWRTIVRSNSAAVQPIAAWIGTWSMCGGISSFSFSTMPRPRVLARAVDVNIRSASKGSCQKRTIQEHCRRRGTMKVAGLFAGIGGLELGLHQAGHEAVVFSEMWPPAAAVLERRFDGVHNAGDIANLKSLPSDVELVAAGFPCQDLSQAGKTAGIKGRKSGLVGHVFRLIDRQSPKWVLLENVSFMLRLDGGSAMNHLVSEFESRGYQWAYRVVNSLSFLPQRRERVFFLASLEGDPADVLMVDEAVPVSAATQLNTHAHGFYWTEGTRGLGWGPDCVPTLKNGSTVGIPSPPAILLTNGEIVTPDIRDAERLQGLPAGWTKPAEGVSRASMRWSLVGNAVTKPVAAWIGRRLSAPKKFDRSRDGAPLVVGDWPRAARYDGTLRREVRISEFPVWRKRKPLEEFLSYEPSLLSARATAGFLSRIEKSTLRFVPGFKDRVRRHLIHVRALDDFLAGEKVLLAAE
jgi:DNA (cytosine-5)-methyltransferase 1